MARNPEPTSDRRGPKDAGRRMTHKPCTLCRDKAPWVDYKDVAVLRRYMSDRGRIRAQRVTGNCIQHQRAIALAVKTARELALLPYAQRTVTERAGGRGRGRAERGDRPGRPPGRQEAPVGSAEGERPTGALERTLEVDAPGDIDRRPVPVGAAAGSEGGD